MSTPAISTSGTTKKHFTKKLSGALLKPFKRHRGGTPSPSVAPTTTTSGADSLSKDEKAPPVEEQDKEHPALPAVALDQLRQGVALYKGDSGGLVPPRPYTPDLITSRPYSPDLVGPPPPPPVASGTMGYRQRTPEQMALIEEIRLQYQIRTEAREAAAAEAALKAATPTRPLDDVSEGIGAPLATTQCAAAPSRVGTTKKGGFWRKIRFNRGAGSKSTSKQFRGNESKNTQVSREEIKQVTTLEEEKTEHGDIEGKDEQEKVEQPLGLDPVLRDLIKQHSINDEAHHRFSPSWIKKQMKKQKATTLGINNTSNSVETSEAEPVELDTQVASSTEPHMNEDDFVEATKEEPADDLGEVEKSRTVQEYIVEDQNSDNTEDNEVAPEEMSVLRVFSNLDEANVVFEEGSDEIEVLVPLDFMPRVGERKESKETSTESLCSSTEEESLHAETRTLSESTTPSSESTPMSNQTEDEIKFTKSPDRIEKHGSSISLSGVDDSEVSLSRTYEIAVTVDPRPPQASISENQENERNTTRSTLGYDVYHANAVPPKETTTSPILFVKIQSMDPNSDHYSLSLSRSPTPAGRFGACAPNWANVNEDSGEGEEILVDDKEERESGYVDDVVFRGAGATGAFENETASKSSFEGQEIPNDENVELTIESDTNAKTPVKDDTGVSVDVCGSDDTFGNMFSFLSQFMDRKSSYPRRLRNRASSVFHETAQLQDRVGPVSSRMVTARPKKGGQADAAMNDAKQTPVELLSFQTTRDQASSDVDRAFQKLNSGKSPYLLRSTRTEDLTRALKEALGLMEQDGSPEVTFTVKQETKFTVSRDPTGVSVASTPQISVVSSSAMRTPATPTRRGETEPNVAVA